MAGETFGLDDIKAVEYRPLYVERELPGFGTTYIHGYTWRDFERIKRNAVNQTWTRESGVNPLDMEPEPIALRFHQLIQVCRVEPYGAPTFVIPVGQEREGMALLQERLPYLLVETICRESDRLSLDGYVPLQSQEERQTKRKAAGLLIEEFAKPDAWSALNYLSQALYGKPLCELDDQSIGEAYSALVRHQQAQSQIIEAIYAMLTATGGGIGG